MCKNVQHIARDFQKNNTEQQKSIFLHNAGLRSILMDS